MKRALLTVATLLLATPPLFAQAPAQQSQLRLTVIDQTMASVPGAAVRVTRPDGTDTTVTTNDRGQATVQDLPAGTIRLRVEFSGFEPFDVPLTLRRGANDATVTLVIQGFKEEVDVVDSTATDDRSGNSLTTTLEEKEIAELPDDPQELQQVLEQMTGGAGAVFQVDGFRGGTLPPRDEIRQIRFRVNSFSADNHDAGRVQVQIITRPNVRQWSGNANFGLRSDVLNARNAFAREQTPELFRRFSAGMRGPIVSGRTSLRFYVDGNQSFDSGTIVAQLEDRSTMATVFRRPVEATNVTVGIEHALTDDQTLRIEYRREQDARRNQGVGDFSLLERAFTRSTTEQRVRMSVQSLFANRILSQSRIEVNVDDSESQSLSNAPTIRVIDAFARGGAGVASQNRTKTVQFANDTDFTRGRHVMRTGVLFDVANFREFDARNAAGTFTFSSIDSFIAGRPDTFTQRLGTADTSFAYYQLGLYFQDDIRLNRTLSISLGARQEMQSYIDDRLNVMPRLGFTWNPGGSRTAIRGGYGVFYDWYDASLHDQTIRVNGELQRDLLILDPGYPDPAGGLAAEVLPGGRVQADPNLRMPTLHQASIGVDRPIGPFLTLQASYQWQRGHNQLRSRNVNAPDEFGVRQEPHVGTVTQIESTGRMKADRLTFNASYRVPQRNIFFNLGYTLSEVKNHASNATSLPANSLAPDADWGPSSQDVRHRLFSTVNYTFPLGIRVNLMNQYASAPPYTITSGRDDNRDGVSNDRPVGVGRNTARGSPRLETNLRVTRVFGFGGPRGGDGGPRVEGPPGGGPPPGGFGGGGGRGGGPPGGGGPGGGGGGPGGGGFGGGNNNSQRFSVEFYTQASNLFNRVNYGIFSGNLRSPFFGLPTSAGPARRVEVGINFRF
ncbi:MAG: carboxypeptidase regulatory-like domain-containing protein [Vicinamibacterales bacterium]